MTEREHRYRVVVEWTGNTGSGTSSYREYERGHRISAPDTGKPDIAGSADPAFRGDPSRWNPEELLVAAVSACHELWYLHLCADAGIVVTAYVDRAEGVLAETSSGGGRFRRVVLHPRVTLAPGADHKLAMALHGAAHGKCFIANSVNFPIEIDPEMIP